jgi:hypothetical protein
MGKHQFFKRFMKTILLVDNRPKASQLYSVGLEAYVGATVIECHNIDEAAEYLFSNAPRIVITRSPIEQRDIALKFAILIEQKKLETELIVLGTTKISSHQATLFDENVEVREVIKKCASILDVSARDMADQDVGNYYRIKINLLCAHLVLICSVYRMNIKGEYIKFLDTGHKIHPEILMILSSSNEEHIYVEASDRLKFVNSLTVFLAERLADDNLSLEDSLLFANQGYRVVREAARKMMITPEIIQMTEANINTMTSIVNRMPKLKQMLQMTTKDVNVMFRHSLLTCYIASHIIDKMEWGNQEQKVKIAFVSFFHDISINEDAHVLVHTDEELERLDATQEQKINIKRHAINSAKILNKYYTSLPFGVETIVKQHHGSRDGVGFCSYPMSISPLALVFLVAEEWVGYILKAEALGAHLSKEEALDKIKLKYKGFSYQNIIKAIKHLSI